MAGVSTWTVLEDRSDREADEHGHHRCRHDKKRVAQPDLVGKPAEAGGEQQHGQPGRERNPRARGIAPIARGIHREAERQRKEERDAEAGREEPRDDDRRFARQPVEGEAEHGDGKRREQQAPQREEAD